LISGKRTELETLPMAQHRSPKWEIEPFRWLGVRYTQGAFGRIDLAAEAGRPRPFDAAIAERIGQH